MMVETLAHTPDNNYYGDSISGGNDTVDKVFLLSADEVKKYFPEKGSASVKDMKKYWLRSPGSYSTQKAASVANDIFVGFDDYGICWEDTWQCYVSDFLYVRPAIWISVE